jgi:hypothetical protein
MQWPSRNSGHTPRRKGSSPAAASGRGSAVPESARPPRGDQLPAPAADRPACQARRPPGCRRRAAAPHASRARGRKIEAEHRFALDAQVVGLDRKPALRPEYLQRRRQRRDQLSRDLQREISYFVDQEHEVKYWSEKFGVSRDQLKNGVAKVGSMVKNVRDHLHCREQLAVPRTGSGSVCCPSPFS